MDVVPHMGKLLAIDPNAQVSAVYEQANSLHAAARSMLENGLSPQETAAMLGRAMQGASLMPLGSVATFQQDQVVPSAETRQRIEAEKQRLLEIEQREAALRAQEAEMAEFRAWKTAQAAAAQVQPEPIAAPVFEAPSGIQVGEIQVPPSAPAAGLFTAAEVVKATENLAQAGIAPAQVSFEQERTEAATAPQFNPVQAPMEVSPLEHLAKYRSTTVSDVLSQPEAKVFWNMAIDHIHAVFTTSTEQLTKAQWAEVFLRHKR
jgi:hypothetical protein